MTVEEALKELGEWYAGFANKPSKKAIKIIMDAAEKQIPKKIIESPYKCPRCGRGVVYNERHCFCGQTICWSNVYPQPKTRDISAKIPWIDDDHNTYKSKSGLSSSMAYDYEAHLKDI